MKKSFLAFAILLSACVTCIQGCSSASNEKKQEQTEEKAVYQCPMDCEKGKTHDKAGQCPVCGMDLEKAPVKS